MPQPLPDIGFGAVDCFKKPLALGQQRRNGRRERATGAVRMRRVDTRPHEPLNP